MTIRSLSIVGVALSFCGSLASAAETPASQYDIDTTCAALPAAAIQLNALPATISAAQIGPVGEIFTKQAVTLGKSLGKEPTLVLSDITSRRRSIVAVMSSKNEAQARQEKASTSLMVEKCAALLGFEVERAAAN